MFTRSLFAPLRAILSVLLLATGVSHLANATGLPVVLGATVDYTHNTLTVTGQNFGTAPSVTLGTMTFATSSAASNQIVANFPAGTPPVSFTPGSYFLTLQFKNQLPAIFEVDIGANGPAGPAGARGLTGPQGAIGATGPAGPTGLAGTPGPMGPAGMNGATGATGPAGAQGPPGASGLQGPQGPSGSGSNTGNVIGQISICGQAMTRSLVYIPGRSFNAYTGSSGTFELDAVPAGTYSIVLEPPAATTGMTKSLSNISVSAGQTTDTGTTTLADVSADASNCGSCGNVCATPPGGVATCQAGQCGAGTCNAGFADCDGSSANGCEVNLSIDNNNCGKCGHVCGANSLCRNYACAAATCNDGIKDGQETDTDCGGPSCFQCAPDRACQQGSDCSSGVCGVNNVCQ